MCKVIFCTNDVFDAENYREPFCKFLLKEYEIHAECLIISLREYRNILPILKKLIVSIKSTNHEKAVVILRGVELSIFVPYILIFFNTQIIVYLTGLGSLWGNQDSFKTKSFKFFFKRYLRVCEIFGVKFWMQNTDDIKDIGVRANLLRGSGIKILSKTIDAEYIPVNLLFAGRLTEEKGIGDLIIFAKNLPMDWHLTICGELDKEVGAKRLQEFKTICGYSNVSYLGFVNDMSSVLLKNKFIFYPTKYREGTPRIVLEGLSLGLVPIIPYLPGLKELFNEVKVIKYTDPISAINSIESITFEDFKRMSVYNVEMSKRLYERQIIYQSMYKSIRKFLK